MHSPRARGFTLVETLVAACLLAVGLMALAELAVRSLRASVVAGTTTYAALLAGDKVERLRGEVLVPSPPGTLDRSVPGYVDHLDRAGRVVGVGATPPGAAAFTRRWAVVPLPGSPHVRVVHVEVRTGGITDGFAAARVVAAVRGEGSVP
jgi:type II secretory pathway pseudopilin PulG